MRRMWLTRAQAWRIFIYLVDDPDPWWFTVLCFSAICDLVTILLAYPWRVQAVCVLISLAVVVGGFWQAASKMKRERTRVYTRNDLWPR